MLRLRPLLRLLVAVTASSACLWAAVPALAAGAGATADCNAHGRLTQHYPAAQLRQSLSTMGADVKEYTDCYDVIQRALLAQVGSAGGGGGASQGSGGSFLPTPLIVVLVVLVLGAGGFALVAARRRGQDQPG